MAKVKLGPVGVLAGLQGGLTLSVKEWTLGVEQKLKSDVYSGVDAGGIIGGEVQILFFAVEARYYWGFVDMINSQKNNYLQLGLKIRLNKEQKE